MVAVTTTVGCGEPVMDPGDASPTDGTVVTDDRSDAVTQGDGEAPRADAMEERPRDDGSGDVTDDLLADVQRDVAQDVVPDGALDVVPDGALDVSSDAPSDVARDGATEASADAAIVTPGDPGMADVRMTVRGDLPRRPISPFIYGWNSPDWRRARGVTFVRVGGNRMTAWNWENNASNAGSDYMFQNDGYLCQTTGCDRPGEVARRAVDDAFAHASSIVLTLPMAGYVAADTRGGGDVRASGASYLTTRFRRSVARKGSAFANPPSLTDDVVYQDEFVDWVNHTWPDASRGGRSIFYELDNEPDLWSSTHAEIHPARATYAEMLSRTTELAAAVKAVTPTAVVFGPVSYGWQGYVNLQDAPDAAGRDFLDTYLTGLRDASERAGRRLVDVLDLHWYPEAQGGGVRITADGATTALADARVQAPRSLWDSAYTETSWITMWSTHGPIALLPRLQAKIDARWPGTRVALSEYYYGGGADISGGVAEADALGVFGREGVFAANVWHIGSTDDRYIYAALAMFRDYDGAGGAFGDTSLRATVDDDARTAVYASADAAGTARMVVVAINRSRAAITASLTVTDTRRYTRAEAWQLTATAASPQRAADLTATAANAFRVVLPAMSVTTLVLRP